VAQIWLAVSRTKLVVEPGESGPGWGGGARTADHIPSGGSVVGHINRVPGLWICIQRNIGDLTLARAVCIGDTGAGLPARPGEVAGQAATCAPWRHGIRVGPRGF